MTDLPEPVAMGMEEVDFNEFKPVYGYTATQMREYRNQALEEAVTEIERHADLHIEDIVAAIRALKEQK